jgi:ribosomal protein S18 acetylase RimI-like enzyme
MEVTLRQSEPSDIPFLREMLFEAVYWRKIESGNAPEFEEAILEPEVGKILADWGNWEGDLAVIAMKDSRPVGAAWFRYWHENNSIRGHISSNIPTLVIGVHKDHRGLGIGSEMIRWLARYAAANTVPKISLMVSKDNRAFSVYRKCGFVEYEDVGESYLMTLATGGNSPRDKSDD